MFLSIRPNPKSPSSKAKFRCCFDIATSMFLSTYIRMWIRVRDRVGLGWVDAQRCPALGRTRCGHLSLVDRIKVGQPDLQGRTLSYQRCCRPQRKTNPVCSDRPLMVPRVSAVDAPPLSGRFRRVPGKEASSQTGRGIAPVGNPTLINPSRFAGQAGRISLTLPWVNVFRR